MYPPSGTGPASKKNSTFYVNYNNIRKFSECSHNLLEISYFLEKIMKRIYNILYITFTHPFSHFIHDFHECSHNSLVGRGIYDF